MTLVSRLLFLLHPSPTLPWFVTMARYLAKESYIRDEDRKKKRERERDTELFPRIRLSGNESNWIVDGIRENCKRGRGYGGIL